MRNTQHEDVSWRGLWRILNAHGASWEILNMWRLVKYHEKYWALLSTCGGLCEILSTCGGRWGSCEILSKYGGRIMWNTEYMWNTEHIWREDHVKYMWRIMRNTWRIMWNTCVDNMANWGLIPVRSLNCAESSFAFSSFSWDMAPKQITSSPHICCCFFNVLPISFTCL